MNIYIYTVAVGTINKQEIRPFDDLDKAIEFVEEKFDEAHCFFGRRRIYDSLKNVSPDNPYGEYHTDEFDAIITVSQMEISSRNQYDIFLDYEREIFARDIALSYKGDEEAINQAVVDLEDVFFADDTINDAYHSLIDEVAKHNRLEHVNYDDIYEFED